MSFQFENMQAFWQMGGYGFFVWLSFSLSFVAMLVLVFHSLWMNKQIKKGVSTELERAKRILAAREKRKQKQAEKKAQQTSDA